MCAAELHEEAPLVCDKCRVKHQAYLNQEAGDDETLRITELSINGHTK